MFINKIAITNFKSIYGTQEFDFRKLEGLNKLTGPIGAGKTTLCEAILYGLYGQVKGQKISNLVAWNTKEMEVAIEIVSNNNIIYINRGNVKQTDLFINGKQIPAPSKRDIQDIINKYYDVPRIVVEQMCIVSFNASKLSLSNMTPAAIKQFVDDVFGFSIFTKYSDLSNRYRLDTANDLHNLEIKISNTESNISNIILKMNKQLSAVNDNFNKNEIEHNISLYNKKIKEINNSISEQQSSFNTNKEIYNKKLNKLQSEYDKAKLDMHTYEIEGKQLRQKLDCIKSGKCCVCGHEVSTIEIENINNNILNIANKWKSTNNISKTKTKEINELKNKFTNYECTVNNNINSFNKEIYNLNLKIKDEQFKLKENEANLKLISNNYNEIIEISNKELEKLKKQQKEFSYKYNNWSELNELLSKTFRCNLLNQIIPQINTSIQTFISYTGLNFTAEFDEEFHLKIYSSYYKKEIQYNALSTGQKKSIDVSIIFGILSCIIVQAEFNIIILDELFSNMDNDIRNIMLDIMKSNLKKNQSIFVINHADMDDSWFDHKIQVVQRRSKIKINKNEVPINRSIYNIVF